VCGERVRMTGDLAQVFVIAPTPFTRAGLRSMLESEDVLVVGEANSPVEPGFSGADVVVVGGDESLEEVARAVAEEGTQAILVLSEDDRSVPVLRALAPSGWGLVPPDAPSEDLGAAVTAVARGFVVLPRSLTGRLLQVPVAVDGPAESLTVREREVLELLGHGLSNKMIARDLGISEHTVKFHVSSIYAKLGAENRAEAVSLGARLGLISL
jgi:DNA-binding NarL/FixJ family response regulator